MKTVTGRVISAEPISLSKAAKLLSGFASSENGATQAVNAYLRRASAAFNELKSIHREIKSSSGKETTPRSDARRDRRSEDVSIYGQEQDEIKEKTKKTKKKKKQKEEAFVDEKVKEKLEDEQRNEERKNKKRKSDGDIGSEERKSKKKRKSKGD